jgi:Ca2+-binding EF-hand superfamily protein
MDNPDITDDIIEYMIQEVDMDRDGKINLEEFI